MMNDPVMISEPSQIELARMRIMLSALKLEIFGMRHSRGSVYAMIKRQFGLKGSKQSVHDQLKQLVDARYKELASTRP